MAGRNRIRRFPGGQCTSDCGRRRSPSRTFQPISSPKEAVPYSSESLRQDLQRVRDAWDDCQASRDRNAIYAYLTAVYKLVGVWAAEGREIDRARRALRLQRL